MFLTSSNLKVRNWVFSIPKRLRIYFLYDRKLLAKLSVCAWKVMSAYLKSSISYDGAVPGASIAKVLYTSKDRKSRKVYEVDPLVCPKCQGPMRIIGFW